MKTPSGDLYQLIRSLTEKELKFFKNPQRRVNRREKIYMKLFLAIIGQKTGNYNEHSLKNMLAADERLVRRMPKIKHYLYQLVLKNCCRFHNPGSLNAEMSELIQAIEVLFEKRLFVQCGKALAKAKEFAYRYERLPALLDIISWEKKLLLFELYAGKTTRRFESLSEEENRILLKIKNISAYWDAYSEIYRIASTAGDSRSTKDFSRLDHIINQKLFSGQEAPGSYHAKVLFFKCKGMYHRIKREWDACYRYFKGLVDLEENFADRILETPTEYLGALENLVSVCRLSGKDEAYRFAEKKLHIQSLTTYHQAHSLINSYINELQFCSLHNEFEKGTALVPEIEQAMIRLVTRGEEANILVLTYLIFGQYFVTGDYKNALKWLNKILTDTSVSLRHDMHANVRIVNLILHYELGNDVLLEHLTASTYRFLFKKKRLFKFENIVILFLRKMLYKDISRKELILLFKKVHGDLLEITRDPVEKKALEYFDFISWLESKISGRPFAEVVREKAEKV